MITFITYSTTLIILIIFIYLIPGIALFPSFVVYPRTTAAIPFISISLLVSLQYFLTLINQFTQQNVLIIVGIISSIGIYRLSKTLTNNNLNWSLSDLTALSLIFFSCIPLMIILGSDGFQHADEIYSWNTWAKKIFLNQQVTFESTQSPYPLALSSLIAFCYKLIGNVDYQLPIKLAYSIVYISTIFSIYSFVSNKKMIGIFFITYVFVVLVIGVGYEYKKVYADTLMGGFLVCSLSLLISLSKEKSNSVKNLSNTSILFASLILISMASLSKQGAMPWSLIFYPLLAYLILYKNKSIPRLARLGILIPILTPILWYEIAGKGFNGNLGVIGRSMGDREYLDQLFFGFNESFINHPFILIFMIVVFSTLLKKISIEKSILALGILTSTILLLFFGAYETNRLYLHIILVGWLITTSYNQFNKTGIVIERLSKIGNSIYAYLLIGLLFIFWSISTLNYKLDVLRPVKNILDGREVQANWIIGKDGAKQYRDIINSGMGFWAQDSHLWGIFFGLDNFYRGEDVSTTNISSVADSIVKHNIGWIYSSDIRINRLESFCEKSVKKIKTSKNSYNQTLYKIDPIKISNCLDSEK